MNLLLHFPLSYHILHLISSFLSLLFLFFTRNNPGYAEKDKKVKQEEKKETKNDLNINMNVNIESSPIVSMNLMPHNGCEICQIEKVPLRSHHCDQCQKCVKGFDHHCWILAGCIGENNRITFILFLFFQSISICYSIYGIFGLYNKSEGNEGLTYLSIMLFSVMCLFGILFF